MNGANGVREARRWRRNLVTRSHPARTFAGLAVFAALLFLSCGIYLIAQPLIDPMAGHEVGVIAGAFTIALAAILLFYLVKPAPDHHDTAVEQRELPAPGKKDLAAPKKLVLDPVSFERTRIRP